jgi:glucosamine--fructose-6-phosphate aminotransferase (isomerizing)
MSKTPDSAGDAGGDMPSAQAGANATQMYIEAGEAAEVVRAQLKSNRERMVALGARLRAMQPRAVVTIGRGSSDHAATFAQYLIETRLGVMTSSAAPSVSSLYKATPEMDGVVCLAISQSGKSPDLLTAVEGAKAAGAFVIALVNDETSPLAGLADEVAPLGAGPELSVAATKSYITALSAIVQLVGCWTQDDVLLAALADLPNLLEQAWTQDWSSAVDRLKDARNLYVIGRRSSSRRPAACMPRPSAPPKSGTGRWRWWARTFRCWPSRRTTRAGPASMSC